MTGTVKVSFTPQTTSEIIAVAVVARNAMVLANCRSEALLKAHGNPAREQAPAGLGARKGLPG